MKVLLPKKKTVMFTSIGMPAVAFYLATQLDMELMASDDQGQINITADVRPGIKASEVDKVLLQI